MPAAITIEVSEDTATSLTTLARYCTEEHQLHGGTSHGALGMPGLLAMLAQDAARVIAASGQVGRPRYWPP